MLGRWPIDPGLWLAFVGTGGVYAAGVLRLHARGRRWRPVRSACFAAGLLVVATALISPLATRDEAFPVHMVQHMLLGMLGPLLLALSAPVTLALRTAPRPARRALVNVLRSRVVQGAAHPAVAVGSFIVGLIGLYFTPLYGATISHPVVHELVHVHVLVAGCLLSWVFIGLDPVPRRGSTSLRAGLLLTALGAHAAIARLLYAGRGDVSAPVDQLHTGALLMSYGGDAIDLMLLIAFFAQWYAAGGRRIERARRRARLNAQDRAAAQLE
jgi:putative membrane protein